MRKPLILLVALFAGSQSPVPQSGAYHVIRRYALGGDGGWDYLTLDTTSRRLYIARSTRVTVIDADSGLVVGEIPNTPGVHGVALVPELHRGFASAGRDQSVRIFDTGSLHPLARLRTTGGNPDAIVYEPATRRVFTFNGAGANATAIDAVLPGVVGAPCEAPTGLALDARHDRLFVGCSNRLMAVVDAARGRIVATLPIGGGVDGVAFDPATGLAFSSNGEGTLTVVREATPDSFVVVENAVTQRGARTLALDPRTHTVFVVTAEFGPAPAPSPEQPLPRPSVVPGSFVVLVLGP